MHTTVPSDFNAPTPLMFNALSLSLRRDLSRAAQRTGPVFRDVAAVATTGPADSATAGSRAPRPPAGSLRVTRERLLAEARLLRGNGC